LTIFFCFLPAKAATVCGIAASGGYYFFRIKSKVWYIIRCFSRFDYIFFLFSSSQNCHCGVYCGSIGYTFSSQTLQCEVKIWLYRHRRGMTTGPKKPKTGTFTISSSIFVNADCVCKNKLYEYDDDWIWYEVLTLKARETSILVFT
jgi:hypothetical protein